MNQLLSETADDLAAVLEALDRAAGDPPDHEDQRKEKRHPVRTRCEIHIFKGIGDSAVAHSALARNLTFGGLSVVMTTDDPVCPGRPVEAIVITPKRERTHLAGIVAFCRKIDGGCYELGIEVKAAGRCAILTQDPDQSRRLYDWFAEGLAIAT